MKITTSDSYLLEIEKTPRQPDSITLIIDNVDITMVRAMDGLLLTDITFEDAKRVINRLISITGYCPLPFISQS